jgi:hypothetical protein
MPCSCMHAVKCFSAAVTGAGVAAGLMWAGALGAGAVVDVDGGVVDLLVVPVDPPLVPVVAPVDVLAVPPAVVTPAETVCVEWLEEELPQAVNIRLASAKATAIIVSEVDLRTSQP